jgi:hypothetical protein
MIVRDQRNVIGEVVLASSNSIIVQCSTMPDTASAFPAPPDLGSFVYVDRENAAQMSAAKVESDEELDPFLAVRSRPSVSPGRIYGVVSFSQTSSIDQGRRPVALGIGSEEELRLRQPQIFELLTTELSVVLTAFSDIAGDLFHRLPPKPPRIHAFVCECEQVEIRALTADFGFLRGLVSHDPGGHGVSSDDIAAAALRIACDIRGYQDTAYLVEAGKSVLKYSGNNYARFENIMRQVSHDYPG